MPILQSHVCVYGCLNTVVMLFLLVETYAFATVMCLFCASVYLVLLCGDGLWCIYVMSLLMSPSLFMFPACAYGSVKKKLCVSFMYCIVMMSGCVMCKMF